MEIIQKEGPKRLKRSISDKMLAGVCGGLADYFEIDATIIRLLFVLALLIGGTGILAYLIMWLIVPKEELNF